MQILASPKACGFSVIDYDAMNPEEKTGSDTNNQDTRRQTHTRCPGRGAPHRSFTPPIISREKDAYTAILTRSSRPHICNPCTILGIATLGVLVAIFLSALQRRRPTSETYNRTMHQLLPSVVPAWQHLVTDRSGDFVRPRGETRGQSTADEGNLPANVTCVSATPHGNDETRSKQKQRPLGVFFLFMRGTHPLSRRLP